MLTHQKMNSAARAHRRAFVGGAKLTGKKTGSPYETRGTGCSGSNHGGTPRVSDLPTPGARQAVCVPTVTRGRGFNSSTDKPDGVESRWGALHGPSLGCSYAHRRSNRVAAEPAVSVSGGRLPTAMRALVRRPVGLSQLRPRGRVLPDRGRKGMHTVSGSG